MYIQQLFIYPIKSLAGISLEKMAFDALGAQYDRRYMLVNNKGDFITQRQFPKLCLIDVKSTEGGWLVTLPDQPAIEDAKNHQGQTQMFLPYEGSTEVKCVVSIWSECVDAFDQGKEWANFFTQYLGYGVNLVYLPADATREIDRTYSPNQRYVGFADGFPLLLITNASMHALNQNVEGGGKLEVNRFRPNIVISGVRSAYAEDQWSQIVMKSHDNLMENINDALNNHFLVVKPCSRCAIPTIDPETSIRQPHVWKALADTRKRADGQVYFGQNIIHQNNGAVFVGQELVVKP